MCHGLGIYGHFDAVKAAINHHARCTVLVADYDSSFNHLISEGLGGRYSESLLSDRSGVQPAVLRIGMFIPTSNSNRSEWPLGPPSTVARS